MLLNIKDLSIQEVGKNEYVIRRDFVGEDGLRHVQFICHITNATTNNKELAEMIYDGIDALQPRAAQLLRAPVQSEQNGALSWTCENGHVNNVQPNECWFCRSPRSNRSDGASINA